MGSAVLGEAITAVREWSTTEVKLATPGSTGTYPALTIDEKMLGERLRSWRNGLDRTQRHMAELAKVAQPTLSYYENGKRSIPFAVVQSYASELNVSIDLLTAVTYEEAVASGMVTSA